MKAHQRVIREKEAENESTKTLFGAYWDGLNLSLRDATVQPIDYRTASTIILQYEWLGTMGTTEFAYGMYFDGTLGGVVCFGRTAGTNVYKSAFPGSYDSVITLNRGACAHWTPLGSASKLISKACNMMRANGYNAFISYADSQAGEIGTVYQACNWLFCGQTSPTEQFKTPDGRVRDARLVHAYTRDRRFGTLRYKRSRKEQKQIMIEAGAQFFKGHAKGRYVGIYGSHKQKRELMDELQWDIQGYPKRGIPEPPIPHSS